MEPLLPAHESCNRVRAKQGGLARADWGWGGRARGPGGSGEGSRGGVGLGWREGVRGHQGLAEAASLLPTGAYTAALLSGSCLSTCPRTCTLVQSGHTLAPRKTVQSQQGRPSSGPRRKLGCPCLASPRALGVLTRLIP